MNPRMAILVLPAAAVVLGLIVHSLKFRGAKDTLYFFIAATLFGIARGNIIWWITTVHFESKFPYIFQKQLLGVYHDSLTADAGWIICLYLGSYFAFRISERLPQIRGKLFPMVSLACLFNACLSYAVEATAITMGWWQWNLSTKSAILSDVPIVGIIAWFSVGFDFLIPYYTIRHYKKPGQWWPYLTLLILPLHMGCHLLGGRVSDMFPITPYNIWHWGMVLATLCLPFLSGIKMHRPWLPALKQAGRRRQGGAHDRISMLPPVGLGVVAAVLLISDLGITRDPALLVSKTPLALYAMLAVHSINPIWLLAGAGALAALGGRLFLPPLLVLFFYFGLWGKALWSRFGWLKPLYVLVPLLLTGVYYDWNRDRNEVDARYGSLIRRGLESSESGDIDGAIGGFERAAVLKPNSLPAYQNLSILYSRIKRYDDAERTLRKMLELRPISEEVHANLGNVYLLRGDLDEAERWFQMALKINPSHEYSRRMIGEVDRLRAKRSAR